MAWGVCWTHGQAHAPTRGGGSPWRGAQWEKGGYPAPCHQKGGKLLLGVSTERPLSPGQDVLAVGWAGLR